MNFTKKILGLAFLVCLLGFPRIAKADEQQLQFGYVFNDYWTVNSTYGGTEHRVPVSYSLTTPNFGLRLSSAFVAGDYKNSDGAIPDFNSAQLSDSTIGMNLDLDMGGSVKSSFIGSMNVPTGDTTWEAKEQANAIPYIFEPSFYHGRGFGANLFYTLDMSSPGSELGLGAGYMATSTYDTGLSDEGTYYPGDTVAAMGTVGFKMSAGETWGFRVVHTFPLEATYSDAQENFTAGQSSIFTSQWTSKMGKDKFVMNLSYSLYNKGFNGDPLAEDPGIYFGDRLEIHPILGYAVGKDTAMETGLIWDRVFHNGYSLETDPSHQGGGNLLGIEQSITFQLDPGTFWNFAGLYHFISNDDVNLAGDSIVAGRFTLGTNVGFKW